MTQLQQSEKPSTPYVENFMLNCGKDRNEVAFLIAGPCVSICDECVQISNNIIIDELRKSTNKPTNKGPPPPENRIIKDGDIKLPPRNDKYEV